MRSILIFLILLCLGACLSPATLAGGRDGSESPVGRPVPMATSESAKPDGTVGTPAGAVALLILIVLVVVILAVGFALCLAASASACLLLALGVISTSTLIGLLTRRASLGIRALVAQVCILSSIGSAVVGVWLGSRIGHLGLSLQTAVAIGLGCGLILGAALAGLVDYLLGFASRILVTSVGAQEPN